MRQDTGSLAHLSMLLAVLALSPAFFLSCAPSRTVKPTPGNERSVSEGRGGCGDCKSSPDRLKKIVDSYLGVRYRTGGMDRRGFDCSGFVVTVFREFNGERLPRSTRELKRVGRKISKDDARPGDLVFVKGGVFGSINHVGIYMGNGAFAHASSSHGVRYDRLDDEYYTKHFAMIRRIF